MADNPADAPGEGSLTVAEIFYSIQGESTFAGFPCFFIRLSGCNLRCSFCDTTYAYEEKGREYTVDELTGLSRNYPSALIQITGGEPLLQENVYPLMSLLLEQGRTVLLETNGSIHLNNVPAGVVRIMDLKCPDSGMSDKMDFSNLELLTPTDELKFVIGSRSDYEWACKILAEYYSVAAGETGQTDYPRILFSPETSRLSPSILGGWILEDQLQVRLQLQLHKLLWPQESRGV